MTKMMPQVPERGQRGVGWLGRVLPRIGRTGQRTLHLRRGQWEGKAASVETKKFSTRKGLESHCGAG
jgi:hypothetical protein